MASKKKTRTFVRETQAWNLCILERVTSQLDGGQKARKACRYSPPPPLPLKRARCSSHLSLFRSIVVVRANLHRRAAPRRAENSANPLWTGQESGGGMSLLNASRQPMHANAYLTGLQAPSFTTPEPVDLRSPPGPIGSPLPLSLPPSLFLLHSHERNSRALWRSKKPNVLPLSPSRWYWTSAICIEQPPQHRITYWL